MKGKITKQLLNLLNINFTILKTNNDLKKFDKKIKVAKKNKSILACLIEQGTLEKSKNKISKKDFYDLDKGLFLKTLLENIPKNSKVISSTGYNSREIMYLRDKFKLKNSKDFYMVEEWVTHPQLLLVTHYPLETKLFVLMAMDHYLCTWDPLKLLETLLIKNFKYIL